MKQDRRFKPQNLRTILSVFLIIILLAGSGAFYVGLGMVHTYSEEVNQRLADAEANSKQTEELQALKSQLSDSSSLVKKANKLFATPKSYQSQALADIKNYANDAGLNITGTSFDSTAPHTIVVSIESPASYKGLVTFLNNIEGNLPKMQVSSLPLSATDSGGSDSVGVGKIKIDISVR